jgi:hypothetical protein
LHPLAERVRGKHHHTGTPTGHISIKKMPLGVSGIPEYPASL